MTGRLFIDGRAVGEMISIRLPAVEELAILTCRDIGLREGEILTINGANWKITGGAGDALSIALCVIPKVMEVERGNRGAPKFGGDRPYLKRKKGRS